MKIALCLLVFNEAEGCKIDVPRLPRDEFEEIFAVDGGSTDGTVEYLENEGIPVYRQPKPGLNAAYVHAADKATGDAVVIFFPKGTIDPKSLLQFRPLLESGHDLVIASRNIPGGQNEEDRNLFRPRKWSVLMLAYLAALLWNSGGYTVKDVLHGYKGFTISAFRRISPADVGLSIDIEMVVRAYKIGLAIAEFPVNEMPRGYGKSHFPMFSTGIKLLDYLWHEYRQGTDRLRSE